MAGGDIKPATQNRLWWKGRQLPDQQQKHLLRRILGQRDIAKNTVAGRFYHRPMQGDEVGTHLFIQRKHTVPGALRRVELASGLVVDGHTMLLPHTRQSLRKSFVRVAVW